MRGIVKCYGGFTIPAEASIVYNIIKRKISFQEAGETEFIFILCKNINKSFNHFCDKYYII